MIPKSVFVLCLNIKKKLLIFFINLNCFNVMILKINLKKKYYFNIFSSEKHFEKQLLLQFQTLPKNYTLKL